MYTFSFFSLLKAFFKYTYINFQNVLESSDSRILKSDNISVIK